MSSLIQKNCPTCGVLYGIPKTMDNNRRENGEHWYCPNGHSIVYSEPNSSKLEHAESQLKYEKESHDYYLKKSNKLEKSIIGYKGVIGKMKKNRNGG